MFLQERKKPLCGGFKILSGALQVVGVYECCYCESHLVVFHVSRLTYTHYGVKIFIGGIQLLMLVYRI